MDPTFTYIFVYIYIYLYIYLLTYIYIIHIYIYVYRSQFKRRERSRGRAPGPNFLGHLLPYLPVFSDMLDYFRLRPLPPPNILPNSGDMTGGRSGGPGAKVSAILVEAALRFSKIPPVVYIVRQVVGNEPPRRYYHPKDFPAPRRPNQGRGASMQK